MSLLAWRKIDVHGRSQGGFGGKVQLFFLTRDSRRNYPGQPYVMVTTLPGLTHERYRGRDEAELRARADEVLATWLGRLVGLPDDGSEEQACDTAFEDWWEHGADLGRDWHPFAEQTYAAGWLARAARGKGVTP
jgi:hypothetical protein